MCSPTGNDEIISDSLMSTESQNDSEAVNVRKMFGKNLTGQLFKDSDNHSDLSCKIYLGQMHKDEMHDIGQTYLGF
jgi:hypothetical protein